MDAEFVRYSADGGVAVITIDRPQAANAQNPQMLRELDQAWSASDLDPDVGVVVLRSEGKHFSAGHDMQGGGDPARTQESRRGADGRHLLRLGRAATCTTPEGGATWSSPSIAAVQGKCIAAGLMLCWPCDLIVAADNAQFSDPVGLMGMPGVEFFAHPWRGRAQAGQADPLHCLIALGRAGARMRHGQRGRAP